MRILVVGRDFPTKENHMMGSFEYDQAKMLVRNGHKVYYLFVDLRSLRHWRKFGFVKQEVDGVSVVAMNIPIGRALPADVRDRLYAPLRKYQMKMFCRYFGTPDVVYVHYPALYPYEIFAPVQALGARVVGTEHWSKVQNRDLPEKNLQNLKDFVEKADAVTCVGGALKKSIAQLTGTKREIIVIPNIVSAEFGYQKRERNQTEFHFLAVGRLSQEKGYAKLIHGFCEAFSGDDTVRLHIAGGGDEYPRLLELIAHYHAEERITLHGVMDKEKLAALYHRCDVLLMPSDYETFGVPAAEAMSCGLPVIVTENTGMATYITDEIGVTVPDNRVSNISAAMKAVRENIDRYDGVFISEFANTHFSEAVVYEKIRSVLEKTAKGETI